MIEAIQVAALDAAQAGSGAGAAQKTQVTAFEVGQFNDAYARGGGPAGGVATPTVAQPQAPSEALRAFGVFADNLNSGAEQIKTMAAKMAAADDQTRPSMMLQMTLASHQFLFKAELTSNVANRTSDGIQQLFRQQS